MRPLAAIHHRASEWALRRAVAMEAISVLDDEPFEVACSLAAGVAYTYRMGVDGDIAEFGCGAGRSTVALAAAIGMLNARHPQSPKCLWLFDSFEGLPSPSNPADAVSDHVLNGLWKAGGSRGISRARLERAVRKHLDRQRVAVIPGWYKDSVARIPSSARFSLVHIDSQLYESARDVLNGLFSRAMIWPGAYVYFTGYDCNAANPKHGERLAWAEAVERFKIEFSDQGTYGISGHRFIVHGYRR